MAATFVKKWAPGNVSIVTIGTDNTTNPNTERRRIAEVWQNVDKYNGCSALTKGSINSITLGSIISAVYGLNVDIPGVNCIFFKKDAGGGWIEAQCSSSSTTGAVQGKVDNTFIKINKPAYDALAAAGKADIDAITIGVALSTPFS